jgi:hypothetical protein
VCSGEGSSPDSPPLGACSRTERMLGLPPLAPVRGGFFFFTMVRGGWRVDVAKQDEPVVVEPVRHRRTGSHSVIRGGRGGGPWPGG